MPRRVSLTGRLGSGQAYLADSVPAIGSAGLPLAASQTTLPGQGELADDNDAAADGDAGDVDPVRRRVARAVAVLPEPAQDPGARDPDLGVFGNDNVDVPIHELT